MDLKFIADVDTTQLDDAIKKMEYLLELSKRVNPADSTLGIATASALLAATPQRISRRALLRWWLPR